MPRAPLQSLKEVADDDDKAPMSGASLETYLQSRDGNGTRYTNPTDLITLLEHAYGSIFIPMDMLVGKKLILIGFAGRGTLTRYPYPKPMKLTEKCFSFLCLWS